MESNLKEANRTLTILKYNLKYNYPQYLILAVVFLATTPIVFGISDLEKHIVTALFEVYVSLLGIILLPSVFKPEQSKEILDVMKSKSFSYAKVCLLRFLYLTVTMILLIFGFAVTMYIFNSPVGFKLIAGTLITALTLGSLGMLVYAFANNIIVAYMLPIIWVVMNTMPQEKMKYINLYSLSADDSFYEKFILLAISIVMIMAAFVIRNKIKNH